MNLKRRYSKLDELCLGLDQALRSVFGNATTTNRPYPAKNNIEPALTSAQIKQSSALMRVNHAGEVCAQALYHGQRLGSRNPTVRETMAQAALEEGDHLAWCRTRLSELGSHTSYLNPLWYLGSYAIGLTAGFVGDKWSLGFLAETEHQVVKHLESQIALLPKSDEKSYQILQQMQLDEAHHRDEAIKSGGVELPVWVRKVMKLVSRIMVKTAYWV